jgi:hypothetical protein
MQAEMWLGSISSVVGYIGAGIVVVSYFFNQKGLLRSQDWRFPAMNLAGSLLVMVSLYYQPNPPSIAIEVFWSTISIYGIQKNARAA